MNKTFFLTTPIYYPNARPHVGSAYTTIVCDVLARYKRMCGYDVAFLTGTDEHGEKLERAAAATGVTPQEFVDEKRKLFVELWEKLGIPVSVYPDGKPDSLRFIYTSHPDHEKSVQRMLLRAKNHPLRYCRQCDAYLHGAEPSRCPKCGGSLESRPVIYKRQYQGRYCVSDERYISDGTDPVNCDICGRPAELISEENYFFRLSAFQEPLLKLYDQPQFVLPDFRRNEVLSFVKSGLRDISVSRKRIKWGIPWPGDPEQVFYVWYDALTSYMTGIGYAQGENGSAEFQKYWRNKPGESELVHMIGKDILRFHAVYWPAFIMAAYPDQPEMLPTTVFAHGWIYYEQDKMSKSKGNVVYPEPIVDALNSFGAPGNDALRYYLLREAPFGQDTSFSYEGLIQRYNSDLANGLGNLAKRTLTMLHQFCEGSVPSPPPEDRSLAIWDADSLTDYVIQDGFNQFDFSSALSALSMYVSQSDILISKNKPWELAKSNLPVDQGSLKGTLYRATQALQTACALLYPVVPDSAERLWKQLGHDESVSHEGVRYVDGKLRTPIIEPGSKIGKAEPIFPRLDKVRTLAKLDEFSQRDRERDRSYVGALREAPLQANLATVNREHDKPKEALKSVETDKNKESEVRSQELEGATGLQPANADTAGSAVPQAPTRESPAPSPQPPAPTGKISIEDFAKVDMRTGEIKTAEAIPGAKKLLKLTVDIGSEVRQVCAGIAEYYAPEKLIGMKVVVVTNLQPRKLRGVESNGMIVAASIGEEGRPVLVTFNEDVPNGARLR
jgi:methionyl-tRNA synthetase